jgi:methionyl-tRNA formyltransferase
MKLLFIGTVKFSAVVFSELVDLGTNLVGLCTKSGSTFNSDYANLAPIADKAGIPIHYTSNINDQETLSWIKSKQPDVIFCFGWSELVRRPLLQIPPIGVIGFHPAALPANRGRHPIVWALALGLSVTASTFFFMDEGVDSGDVLCQCPVDIGPLDDADALYEKISATAVKQIREFVPLLESGDFIRTPQDPSIANVWRKRGPADGQIDWRMSGQSIFNLVRALSRPYVGAHFLYKDQIVKVWKSRVVEEAPENLEPGKVLEVGKQGIIIKSGVGAVALEDYEPKILLKVGEYL